MEDINLIFSSDKNFIPYFTTSLLSLLKNYKGTRKVVVYLLTDNNYNNDIHEKILKIKKQVHCDFDLKPLIVDASEYSQIKTTVGITVAAYNRLRMHEYLPTTVDRAIYLDSDIIVEGNIDDIYDLNLNNCVFRGAEDSISTLYKLKYDLPMDSHHINSGVMLCNIKMMREIDFTKMIDDFLSAHRFRIVMGDQQIINEVFNTKISELPISWNVHGSMFNKKWCSEKIGKDNSMDELEVSDAVKSPNIIHYTFKRKPWHSLEHPRARTWHRYNEKTPFVVGLPAGEIPTRKNSISADTQKNEKTNNILSKKSDKIDFNAVLKKINGYLISIKEMRKTRLSVNKLERNLLDASGYKKNITNIESTVKDYSNHFQTSRRSNEANLSIALKEIASRYINDEFIARDYISKLPDNTPILCNALQKDLDGGFNENIKTILRTTDIARFNVNNSLLSMILVYRPNLSEFWQCINTSLFYNTPLLFVEMNFFAAFSTYFDKNSVPAERRCLGFILDDMGAYFDARQPSRLETTLNDVNFTMSEDEFDRSRNLIRAICKKRYTKYNKYTSELPAYPELDDNKIVLVVDQKRGDASIEFARADDSSFDNMIKCAIEENPGRSIYFKAHPDNIHRGIATDILTKYPELTLVEDQYCGPDLLSMSDKVYVVSSQMGFEALLHGSEVITFGLPFYAGWGVTNDRVSLSRRSKNRSIEEIFFVSCIRQSVYINPNTGQLIEMEDMFEIIDAMKKRFVYADS